MKVLFAVSNENISETIKKKYQSMYKEIILGKNVYYFNAILKELQKDKSYDRIVISEDLEPFANKNYETIDNFIFEKLDSISDEAVTNLGEDIPIILIATDRRTKGEQVLNKLFGIGVYSTLIGQDRSIEEVCKLINKPRSKKEAKIYYKIDSGDVDYKAESQEDVSEVEIQNILTHYKRLGKNEDKYIESFDSIANQYTDEQLKVIIKFLPLGVKAVLEANSPKYQQLATFAGESAKLKKQQPYNSTQINPKTSKPRNTNKAIVDNGIKIESIGNTKVNKLSKPVVIPTTVSTNNVKKVSKPVTSKPNTENKQNTLQEIEQVKKGRGRPRKVQIEEVNVEEQPKKKRGRPRKIESQEENELPTKRGIYRKNTLRENNQNDILPGFEEETLLPGFEADEVLLPGFDETEKYTSYESNKTQANNTLLENDLLSDFEEETINEAKYGYMSDYEEVKENNIVNVETSEKIELDKLLTSDKKVVAFVGTSKNGTSFLINNVAEILSNQGIKTAILDLTQNRNSYYIYTKNEEALRTKAINCTSKLLEGIAEGVEVNKNLDVYTSLPGENNGIENYTKILSTLVQKYSLVLLDCDFKTELGYISKSQEIYLVQSMDVLTIQPLTAYLRELKAKNVLDQNKLRVVINKYVKVRSVTEKTIIAGMAFYNDPSMSFMTELFNRENIRYTVVPFEMQTYTKYLEGLINCNIATNGYSKDFMNSLKKLGNMVYPLLSNSSKYNQYSGASNFSNDMNHILNKMKNK